MKYFCDLFAFVRNFQGFWKLCVLLFLVVQVSYNLCADVSKTFLSKNVLSVLSETSKVKIDSLDQLPADISFLCADLKYTGKAIKICEFGRMLSNIRSTPVMINGKEEILAIPHWDLFWHYLAQFNKPIWYVGKQKGRVLKEFSAQGKSFETLSEFLTYFNKIARHNKDVKLGTLQDYAGILVVNDRHVKLDKIKQKHSNILIVNGYTDIFTQKTHSFGLFTENNELKNFSPGWKEYKKEYAPELTQTIMRDIPADFYIIKPIKAVQSRGVLMITKEDLDYYLKLILGNNKTTQSPYDDNITYWRTDTFESFYVQEYVPSKEVIIKGKKYDPTMRLFFFLSHDQGFLTVNVLAGYWKIPLKSLDEPGALMEKHISHALLGRDFTGLLIDSENLNHAKKIMGDMLSSLYPKMLKYATDRSKKGKNSLGA